MLVEKWDRTEREGIEVSTVHDGSCYHHHNDQDLLYSEITLPHDPYIM